MLCRLNWLFFGVVTLLVSASPVSCAALKQTELQNGWGWNIFEYCWCGVNTCLTINLCLVLIVLCRFEATSDVVWEKFTLLHTTRKVHDVKIFNSEGGTVTCKNVSKRFVWQLKNVQTKGQEKRNKHKRSYGWIEKDLALLQLTKLARKNALLEGKPTSQSNSFIRNYMIKRGVEKR